MSAPYVRVSVGVWKDRLPSRRLSCRHVTPSFQFSMRVAICPQNRNTIFSIHFALNDSCDCGRRSSAYSMVTVVFFPGPNSGRVRASAGLVSFVIAGSPRAGALKPGRDVELQAIQPLRGRQKSCKEVGVPRPRAGWQLPQIPAALGRAPRSMDMPITCSADSARDVYLCSLSAVADYTARCIFVAAWPKTGGSLLNLYW